MTPFDGQWHPRPEAEARAGLPPPVRLPGDLEGYLLPSYVDLRAARRRIARMGIDALRALDPADLEQHYRDNSWRPWFLNPVFDAMRSASEAAWAQFNETPEGRRGRVLAQVRVKEHEARWPTDPLHTGWRASE